LRIEGLGPIQAVVAVTLAFSFFLANLLSMSLRQSLLRIIAVLAVFLVISGGLYVLTDHMLSLPFRPVNDKLHAENAPITLDFLIPARVHINDGMTIREVIRYRFHTPRTTLVRMVEKTSHLLPARYRILAVVIIYAFWSFLFLVFFRIFTWMRYWTAVAFSFLCGAAVYFFMPDVMIGRWDDAGVLLWAGAVLALLRYRRRRKHQTRGA
jgi:hypothetical protein